MPVRLDITDPASVAAAAELAGDVTLLINNAGIDTGTDLLDGDLDRLRLEMETHYFGTLSVIRAFAPSHRGNGGGAILNVLSVLSWVSFPADRRLQRGEVGGVVADQRAAGQLADQGIRVAGLHVGYMDTDMAAGHGAQVRPGGSRHRAGRDRPAGTRSWPTS